MRSKKLPPQRDHIALSIALTVVGTDFDEMLHGAKLEGAARLHRFEDQVYIISHSVPRAAAQTRFRSHLDEPLEIESWAIDVQIGIKKEENHDGEPSTED
jgi:hypothetical protein